MADPLLNRIDPWDREDTTIFGDEDVCLDCHNAYSTGADGLCDNCRRAVEETNGDE